MENNYVISKEIELDGGREFQYMVVEGTSKEPAPTSYLILDYLNKCGASYNDNDELIVRFTFTNATYYSLPEGKMLILRI